MDKPRVMLTVGSYDKQGGTNTFVRNLSKRLSEKGIYALVISRKLKGESFKDRKINKNLKVKYFPAFPRKRYFLPLYLLRFILMAYYTLKIVYHNKINVILTGETEALPFYISKILGCKVIIRGGNPFPKVVKMEFGRKKHFYNRIVFLLIDIYETIILWLSDRIVILSEWEGKIIRKYTGKKLKTIRYAVDTEIFRPYRKKERKNLIYIGRISYSKKINELVNVFDKVRKKEKTKLFLVGPLEDYDSISHFIKDSKYEKDIIYLGEKESKEVPSLLNDNYIFVHTAFDLGNAPLEAASCGLPVVVLGEKFDEEYIIKSSNVDAFVNNVLKLLKNRNYYLNLSKKNREIVLKKHSWESITESYLNLFQEVIK